jgi:hypothetical protein
MARPTTALTTLRPDLGEYVEFNLPADRDGYIGHLVLPHLPVDRQAGTYPVIPKEELLTRRPDMKRAAGSGFNRTTMRFDAKTYSTQQYGIEELVDKRQREMYADYLDAEKYASMRSMHNTLKEAEYRVAEAVFNATTYTGAALTTAVSIPWSTHATATPLDDIEAAFAKVWDGTGLLPNALIVSWKLFRHLRLCAQVVDKIASSGAGSSVEPGKITAAQLATVFALKQVIVAGGTGNVATTVDGFTPATIWDSTKAMVARIPETRDVFEPGLGRTFQWNEGSNGNGEARLLVEMYEEPQTRGNVYRVLHDVEEKLIYPECGHLLTAVDV